jgi:hypothetical protein
VDFLGWVHFPNHKVLRTATKKRMFAKLKSGQKESIMMSYIGVLQHGNAHKLQNIIEKEYMLNCPHDCGTD